VTAQQSRKSDGVMPRSPTRGAWRTPLAAVLAAWFLAACAVPGPRGPAPEAPDGTDMPEAEPLVVEPEEEPRREEPATPPAALALADRAETARADGELDRAAQQLERALRIAPRDAALWHRMAAVRLEQGRHQQAERMAQRSLQLDGDGDRALALENWRVIAAAREARGDDAGAAAARVEIRRLESGLV